LNRTLIVLLVTLTLLSPLAWAEDLPPAEPLFAATLSDVADKQVAMSAYKGKPLIVNFWARWCAPCREEIPELSKARAKYKARGLEVIGIAIEDKPDAVREFAKAYEIDYPVVLAKSKGLSMMQALGNTRAGLPFTVAINRRGEIVASKLGAMNRADLDAAAEAALK
jgi:thiol-disulfide isomerase/thioredoxin